MDPKDSVIMRLTCIVSALLTTDKAYVSRLHLLDQVLMGIGGQNEANGYSKEVRRQW